MNEFIFFHRFTPALKKNGHSMGCTSLCKNLVSRNFLKAMVNKCYCSLKIENGVVLFLDNSSNFKRP